MLKKFFNTIKLFVLSIYFLHVFSGCVYLSRDKRPDGSVVERNKESRPAWVDSPTDQLLYTASETRFHFAILKARDLPIAVKKSQIAAIEASYPLWLPIFESALREYKELKALESAPGTSRDMAELKNYFAHRIHAEIAQVEDIYFEKIKIDDYKLELELELEGLKEYFDVHTLVHLAPLDQEKVEKDLISTLQSSRNKEIRRIGKQLQKKLSDKRKDAAKPARTKGKK